MKRPLLGSEGFKRGHKSYKIGFEKGSLASLGSEGNLCTGVKGTSKTAKDLVRMRRVGFPWVSLLLFTVNLLINYCD